MTMDPAIPAYHPKVRLFQNVQPWYQADDYIVQMFYAWMGEFDQFDRWLQYESPADLLNVLNGDWLFSHEGVLAAWLARETYGQYLDWWEDMLGIPNNTSIPDNYRRAYLIQRMQQRGLSPTPQFIQAVAEQFVTEATVTPNIPGYYFTVRVVFPRGTTPPAVMDNMQTAIDAAKPAHLGYTIISTEADWKTLGQMDWKSLGNTDWNGLQ